MEAFCKCVSGALAGILSLFAPAAPAILCAMSFVAADFISGVAADRAEARRSGSPWFFRSRDAWRTVRKAGFLAAAVAMMWMLECCVLDFVSLNLTKMFTGFACGVELWSFLENASRISDGPLFERLRQFVDRQIEKEVRS
ncbi:MAG: phage holin family protein [Alistipes sp.]|nr:phage holin family protein [Alistipes sp.]